ncbi:helix-turn-helix domain-containing protein [Spongiactinospora sp. 9N601]|uniref:helix-turn-helix domain-containing protein n=1 Tax=Spongiactinospora sp. 9N601 TaxID=3375149 RepID=UPI00378E85E2
MAKPSLVFGSELRRRREAAGISQGKYGQIIGCSKSWVSKVEAGKVAVTPEFAQKCDDALEADGALMKLVPQGKIKRSRRLSSGRLAGLPPSPQHFTGRCGELARLAAFMESEHGANVCLLTGMAGAGKTALALHAAHEIGRSFPDGVAFFDFGAHTPGGTKLTDHSVLGDLLTLLNVSGEEMPSGRAGRANLYQSRLRGRRMLLVLDNVESSDQIRSLLPAELSCRVLVTSRNRLSSLDQAEHLPVDTLHMEEAIALFRSVGGERAEGAEVGLLSRLVEYCGRLPLAICIAAARFRGNPKWALEDFEAAFAEEEVSPMEAIDDGERSVQTAFAMSCDSLSEDQRRLLGLLALHPAHGIQIRSVAALMGVDQARARTLIDRLGNAHLVAYETADRVTMHDLLREFARDSVLTQIAGKDQDAAMLRLLDHNILLAESCGRFIEPHRHRASEISPGAATSSVGIADRSSAIKWFQAEWPALVALCRMAAARDLHKRCWRLAFALRDYFFLTKQWEPWIDTHRAAVASARAAGAHSMLAVALNSLGIAHTDQGDLASAVEHYQEALQLFGGLQDEHGQTNARSNLAWAALYLGEYDKALHELRTVLAAYRRLGNSRNAAITLRAIALVETELASYSEALEHALTARKEFCELGLPLDVVMSINCAAWVHFNAGDLQAAAALYQDAFESAERCGSRYEAARAMTGLANVSAASGRPREAAEQWARADALHQPLEPTVIGESRLRSWMQPDRVITR